jgi:hypothetical protein
MAEEKDLPTSLADHLLSFDDILEVDDVTYVEVEVPEWKGKVRFGSLSAADVLDFVEAPEQQKKTSGLRLINKSLVDRTGRRIGDDKKLNQLAKKDHRVINRLIEEILKLNGLDKKADTSQKNDLGEVPQGASPTN